MNTSDPRRPSNEFRAGGAATGQRRANGVQERGGLGARGGGSGYVFENGANDLDRDGWVDQYAHSSLDPAVIPVV